MRRQLTLTVLCVGIGLIITLVSGQYRTTGQVTIKTTPDYCIGPAVVGYKCPDVAAQGVGVSKGLPLPYNYEAVTIQKQEGFLKSKMLRDSETSFIPVNFLVDVVCWSLVVSVVAAVLSRLKFSTPNNKQS